MAQEKKSATFWVVAFNILNNEWMDIYDILRIRTQVAIT